MFNPGLLEASDHEYYLTNFDIPAERMEAMGYDIFRKVGSFIRSGDVLGIEQWTSDTPHCWEMA